MKTLKKICLKDTSNRVMTDDEMKLVRGGNVYYTSECSTICDLGNGNLKEISIPNANGCYVNEGVSVTKAFCSGMQDEICYVSCSDIIG